MGGPRRTRLESDTLIRESVTFATAVGRAIAAQTRLTDSTCTDRLTYLRSCDATGSRRDHCDQAMAQPHCHRVSPRTSANGKLARSKESPQPRATVYTRRHER